MFTLASEDIKAKIPGLQLVCAPVTLAVNLYGKVSLASLCIVSFPSAPVTPRYVRPSMEPPRWGGGGAQTVGSGSSLLMSQQTTVKTDAVVLALLILPPFPP